MNGIHLLIGTAFLQALLSTPAVVGAQESTDADNRPNLIFIYTDDQRFDALHANGNAAIRTPHMDQLCESGLRFINSHVVMSLCSPSRAALLAGRNIWQLEEAGTHDSLFPNKYHVYTDLLEQAGYRVGYTGKPWAPGSWQDGGWVRNPASLKQNKT